MTKKITIKAPPLDSWMFTKHSNIFKKRILKIADFAAKQLNLGIGDIGFPIRYEVLKIIETMKITPSGWSSWYKNNYTQYSPEEFEDEVLIARFAAERTRKLVLNLLFGKRLFLSKKIDLMGFDKLHKYDSEDTTILELAWISLFLHYVRVLRVKTNARVEYTCLMQHLYQFIDNTQLL